MKINTYTAGPIDANNYFIWDEETKDAILIDCSDYLDEVVDFVQKENLNVKYILLTHGHFDHILGVNKMKKQLKTKVGIHKADNILLEHTPQMCEMFGYPPAEAQIADFFLDEDSDLSVGQYKIKVLHTPGHTEGGVSYLIDNKVFCGDTMFKGSYGRTDLPGGSFQQIKKSLKDVLLKLNPNTVVFPGHGDYSSIEYEIKYNDINM